MPTKPTKTTSSTARQKLEDSAENLLEMNAKLEAISKSQAVIEFELDGTILTANENFLNAVGFSLEQIQGQHHRIFMDPEEAQTREYADFWETLRRGNFQSGEFKRFTNGGHEIWIQASYNPIFNLEGEPFKVVKFATDITEQKLRAADHAGQIEAVNKAQAVIEFELDGTILSANDNFLATVGYSLAEIQGKHHRMFVEEEERNSLAYREFWEKLGRGEYDANQYKRIGKGGEEVWIQASYNPILGPDGKPFKVVKYATNITAKVRQDQETEAFVAEVGEVLTDVANKNLTARVQGNYTEALHTITTNLNHALSNLEGALSDVGMVTGQLSHSSRQIASGSAQVADGANSQASSIEEISASLEEMSAMTEQNADNAVQASGTANAAADSVKKGATTMKEMQSAIQSIKDSSTETAKIVKTIDEISFQTNMLALNAAVEAARAGDAGKGFAVVAEEVRALAQRSAEAAKMTAQLIEESSRNAESGVEITSSMEDVLGEIDNATVKVKDLLSEMSAASKEQATGIGQITTAVDQMNKVTQDNAANSEESSAAANELDNQINRLAGLIQSFELSGMEMAEAQEASMPASAPVRPALKRPVSGPSPAVFPLDDDDLADF